VNEFLKDRILRRLESLPEERAFQVLDYIEFLESRYADRKAPEPGVVQRLAEEVQNTLRAGNFSAQAVTETMGVMSKAMNVLSGVRAAAESVATDVSGAMKKAVEQGSRPREATPPPPGPAPEVPKPETIRPETADKPSAE